jgi:CheY-like chemotaxis protein
MHDDHPPQGRLRVLVVDDNEDAATTLSLLLELDGHRTGTAATARRPSRRRRMTATTRSCSI